MTSTPYAFTSVMGKTGGYIITFGILFFAFATILGWSVYGIRAAGYLFQDRKGAVVTYKILFTAVVVVGAVSGVGLVWTLSDTFNGLMALPNLVGVFLLSPVVFRISDNYAKRTFGKKKITPMVSCYDQEKP